MPTIKISRKDYEVDEKMLPLNDLEFYPENPRIYSILNADGATPSQEEIESKMITMEHVKDLRVSIKANGGLIDPLIVLKKEDIYVVLEGNSRLAAYRLLLKEDQLQWRSVKCWILPEYITENAIFTLLGQYHLISRKDWSLFEQAGYLHRQKKASGLEIETIARHMGLNESTARKYVEIYSFMKENNDLIPDHWSYYDEYLKNRGLKKYRETNPQIDTTFTKQVKTGEIKQAVDVRNILGKIASADGKHAKKIMNEFIVEESSIYDGFERLEDSGKLNDAYKAVCKFRERLDDTDFQKKIKQVTNIDEMQFQLKKLHRAIGKLLEDFSKEYEQH